jgi:hypothetical protein
MAVVSTTTLKTYFNTGDRPTEANFIDLIDTLSALPASSAPTSISEITQALPFTGNQVMGIDDRDVQSGAYSFTLAGGGTAGYVIQVYIQADGSNTFTFSSDFVILNSSITSGGTLTADVTYLFSFLYDGDKVSINVVETNAAAIDVTSPTLSSATIENATDSVLDLVFDEAVTITTAGWSIATDGAALSISAVASGSGTTTPKFTLSRSVLSTETVTVSYASSTGNTVDGSGNELADITDRSVTNNVAVGSLLLDTYTGAKVAYAVTKLRTAYAGSCIRVRRDNDDAEQDIGFSGNNLDESALTTFVGANNAYVTTWYDQSGNGDNLTQATSTNQPQIVSSGTVIKTNTIASMNFITDDYLQTATLSSAAQPNSFFTVFKRDSTAATDRIFDGLDGDNRQVFGGTTGYQQFAGGTSLVAGTTDLNQRLASVFFNTTDQFYINTSLIGTGDSGPDPATGLTVGDGYNLVAPFRGDIQLLVMYNSDQLSNRAAISTVINDVYSIY